MFFNRLGLKSCESSKLVRERDGRSSRRRWAALSLAVTLAMPASTLLLAQDAPPAQNAANAPKTPQDNAKLLSQGIQQYQNNQYEEAQESLQQVKPDSLSAADRQKLADTLKKVQAAAGERRAARAEFQMGQEALAAKKPAEAISHYQKAAENKYADAGTQRKAREQIALAQDAQKRAAGNLKSLYEEAVKEENAGQLTAARAKFATLQAAGYKTGLFEKSPADFVKDIDQKLAESKSAAKNVDAGDIYQKARSEYNKGDWIAARRDFQAAKAAGFKPGLFEDSPETYLSRMDRKEQADARKHQQEIDRQRQAEADKTRIAQAQVMVRQERQEQEQAKAEAALQKRDNAARQETAPKGSTNAGGTASATATNGSANAGSTPLTAATPPSNTAAPDNSHTAPANATAANSSPAGTAAPSATPANTNTAAASTPTGAANAALDRAANMERIRQQQRQYEAQSFVQQARDAQAAGQNDTALKLYIQAADLDPSNEQAQAGRRELMTLTGRATEPTPQLSERAQEIKVERQAIQYSFRQSIDAAQKAIAANDFGTARNQLNSARLAAARDPQVFSPQEIREFNAQIDNTNLALQKAQQTAEAQERQKAMAAAQQRQAEIERDEARRRQESVAALVRESMRLVQEGKYTPALGVIDQILVLDPNNDYALGTRPLVQDKSNFQEQRRFREEFDQQLTRQLNAAQEKMIPYDDIYRYPANWPDIVEVRDKSVKEEQGLKDVDQAVQAQLDRRLPEVRFDGVAFTDVVDFMRDITGANIFVNWRALEAAGIDKNAPVTARLRDVKFSKALSTILQDVGGTTARLGYTIDEGVITISTSDDLSKNVVTRVYDIRDVLIDVPDFDNAPDFNLSDISNQSNNNNGGNNGGNNNGGGGNNGGGLFGNNTGGNQNQEKAGQSRQERIDQIIKLIQDTVASDSWKDNGGTVGSVRELSGQLIVTQTPENQVALRGLLEQLRETRAIQVTIETRFLTVQRNYLEDIGLDFDFSFNNQGKVSSAIGPVTISQGSSQFTANPTTPAPGSLGGTIQPALQTSAIQYGSGAGGGLGAGTFLDDFQASFLIRATQASSTSTILTSPRVTLFNGQRAYVLVATQTAYVSDLTPVVGSGAVAFDPEISTVQSGVKLDVQATVSSDRKYVTLTLQPQLANLIALLSFQFQTVNATGGAGTGGTGAIPGGTNGAAVTTAGNGIVQQPILQITEVRTTVSVPDGGTLLLGGQTIAGEVEKEEGVPVLSKIPFLKRLFTNRSMARDDQVLLILVKPTIIIQREEEQRQFPLLSSKVSTQ